jgi:cysteine desulfurase/selenocysteine lyase
VDYLAKIGMERIHKHEAVLTNRLVEGLSAIDRVRVYVPERPESRIGVVSFTIDGLHPHQVAQALDEQSDVLVRSGHHCCQPLMERLSLPDGTVRASLALYTNEDEIDLLIASVEELVR